MEMNLKIPEVSSEQTSIIVELKDTTPTVMFVCGDGDEKILIMLWI